MYGAKIGFYECMSNLLNLLSFLSLLAAGSSIAAPTPWIFIHGIKGGRLETLTGKTAWLTASQVLGLDTPGLSLPANANLRPAGVLERVQILPWVAETDVYGSFMERGEESGLPFYPFSYDWRQECLTTLSLFEKFVGEIRLKHPDSKVNVAAHSMGGLIAWALMLKHPDWFERIVYVGVPFKGGVGFLQDLHVGESTGLNSKILSPEVLATFPSVYVLFTEEGEGLVDANGKNVPVNFYSSRDWDRLKMGVMPKPVNFAESLSSAKEFRKQLKLPAFSVRAKRILWPEITVVAGDSIPTLSAIVKDGPKAVRGWDFETRVNGKGDGRITFGYALPPQEVPYEVMKLNAAHADQMNHPDVIEKVFGKR